MAQKEPWDLEAEGLEENMGVGWERSPAETCWEPDTLGRLRSALCLGWGCGEGAGGARRDRRSMPTDPVGLAAGDAPASTYRHPPPGPKQSAVPGPGPALDFALNA